MNVCSHLLVMLAAYVAIARVGKLFGLLIEKFHGIGQVTATKMHELGIRRMTLAQV